MQNDQLKFIRDISWEQVFSDWHDREVDNFGWEEHWKGRGYDSWEEWRRHITDPLQPQDREWMLYEILDPEQFIVQCYAGAFKGWRQYIKDGVRKITFGELDASSNPKAKSVFKSFPQETTIIGIRLGDEVVIIEGMHRSTALAQGARAHKKISGKVFIALTDFDQNEQKAFKKSQIFES
ncbi:MAG: hypothetical protein ABH846_04305 [Patescibacteria group bacterium]